MAEYQHKMVSVPDTWIYCDVITTIIWVNVHHHTVTFSLRWALSRFTLLTISKYILSMTGTSWFLRLIYCVTATLLPFIISSIFPTSSILPPLKINILFFLPMHSYSTKSYISIVLHLTNELRIKNIIIWGEHIYRLIVGNCNLCYLYG